MGSGHKEIALKFQSSFKKMLDQNLSVVLGMHFVIFTSPVLTELSKIWGKSVPLCEFVTYILKMSLDI